MGSKLIKQHNVISMASYDMSAMEKNILYLLMSKIHESDKPDKEYVISISDLENRVGKVDRKELEKSTDKLMTQTYHIPKEESVLIVSLMGFVHYDAVSQVLKIKISRKILPYFVSLKKNFTQFELDIALSMRSKYSKRIYEMLSQHKDKGFWNIEVAELKERLLLVDKKGEIYENWSAFKNQVLEIAKREITQHTDIMFTYEAKKTGRKYTHLEFKITEKPRQLGLFDSNQ